MGEAAAVLTNCLFLVTLEPPVTQPITQRSSSDEHNWEIAKNAQQ
jgi:hypothetical protein